MLPTANREPSGDPLGGWVGRPLAADELACVFSALDHFASVPAPRTLLSALLAWRTRGYPRIVASPMVRENAESAPSPAGDAEASLLGETRAAWRRLPRRLCASAIDACATLGGACVALEVVLDDPALISRETIHACWTALPWCPPIWAEARRAMLATLFRRTSADHVASIGRALAPLLHGGHVPVVEALLASPAVDALAREDVNAARAWLALWADRTPDAEVLGRDERMRDVPSMPTLRAIANLRLKQDLGALRALDEVEESVVSSLPRWERELLDRWKAEGLIRLGLIDEGKAAIAKSSDHPSRPLLTRLREILSGARTRTIDGGRYLYTLKRMRELGVAVPADDEVRDRTDRLAIEALWRAIAGFGGNRGDACTVLEGERLRAVPLVPPRRHAELLQRTLLSLRSDEVIALFERAALAYGEVPYFETYACEVRLWAGDYAGARSRLAALSETTRTRWSFIGLGAAALMEGDPDGAERAWSTGADVYTPLSAEATLSWRAERAMRANALNEAAEYLDQATRLRPTRLRAWLLRALVADRMLERRVGWEAFRRAVGLAPGAAWRAIASARAEGLRDHLVRGTDAPRDPVWTEALKVIATWLERLRGNASSALHTWDDAKDGVLATEALDADCLLRALATWNDCGRT